MVPYGVSSPPGAVGYASAIAELAVQTKEKGITPTSIVHCSGSAGTQAGLVVGAAVEMPATGIVGIDIDAEPDRVRNDVIRYATGAAELLETEFEASAVEVVAGHAGPSYGIPHQATISAMRIAGSQEGLILDPV